MKKLCIIAPLVIALILGLCIQNPVLAKAKDGVHLRKSAGTSGTFQVDRTSQTLVNIGAVAMWIFAQGQSAHTPDDNSGAFFPRGSQPNTAVIYEDGPVWGGLVQDGAEPAKRVGGSTYITGLVPGKILQPGVAEDQNDPNINRIWRIRRDYQTANLRQDAAEFFQVTAANVTDSQIEDLRGLYESDWIDWPADRGAPFYDADGDGNYNPQFDENGNPVLFPDADEPGYANGDQVVWLAANDLDAQSVQEMYGSPSIGIELQQTMWAYNRSDALGNVIFKQYRFMYKGTATTPGNATIDSMYFCQWSDPDVGEFTDDFVGCDTTLSLGYAYNSQTIDNTYAQAGYTAPPAAGYDFFAGPLVEDSAGTAIFGLQERPGFRNLPMTTFGFFAAGQEDSDPTLSAYEGTEQWWNLLRGYRPEPIENPERWPTPDGGTTFFRVPGDPVTGEGWIDANPGDRRLLLASGPFTMAVGDTQETVVALMAGQGSDRLSSVSYLKFIDQSAQETFDNLFVVPSPPAQPNVVATEFTGEIVLNWGSDPARVEETEVTSNTQGYDFEGYNVYQLPSQGATLDQGVRIATFDVANDLTVISQQQFDQNSGLVLELPVQFGTNTGLQRTLSITEDALRDLDLANGNTYFFGVTAYNYNGDATVKTLESTPTIVTVVPQTLKPGERLSTATGDTIPTEHSQGISDGSVYPLVVDPTKITGDDYKVVFVGAPGPNQVWHFINTTSGDTLLKNQSNQSLDVNYLNVEGLQVKVGGAPLDFAPGDGSGAGIIEVTYAGEPACGPDDPSGGCDEFGGDTVWHGLNSNATYYIGAGGGGGGLDRISRYIDFAVPNDYELRFTEEGGWAVFAFEDDMIARVPFEIWNTGSGTPDDPSDDVRMIPFVLSNAGTGDSWGYATGTDPFFGFPNSDWIYWMEPQDREAPSDSYDQFAAVCESNGAGGTYPFDSDGSRDGYWADFQGGFVYPIGRLTVCDFAGNATPPPSGTTIRFLTTKPNTPNDVFTFSTSGYTPSVSDAQKREDVLELVNVFPNPYLGFHQFEETRFDRYVTFSHLPEEATIRIFNLAGIMVRKLEKTDDSQFMTWDLKNENNLPVASGMYIANIDMPGLGTKNLHLAIVQEQQFLRKF